MKSFAKRLCEGVDAVASPIVVGLDPTPEALPAALVAELGDAPEPERILAAFEHFLAGVLEACRPYSAATKIQSAFFERFGWRGFRLLFQTIERARSLGYLVIADAKRNDIGHTARAYADAFLGTFEPFGRSLELPRADALTVTPIFGDEGNRPFLETCASEGRGVFFIVRTSNPSSAQLQALELADGRRFDQAVADLVAGYAEEFAAPDSTWSPIGAVVGATQVDVLAELRERMPRCTLLMPGVGAQGAGVEPLARTFDAQGHGGLVPISRGLLRAHQKEAAPSDWKTATERAARSYAESLRAILPG